MTRTKLAFILFLILCADRVYSQSRNEYTFKPAQADLVAIYQQIGTSLEQAGSPIPYMRRTQTELARIRTLLAAQGKNTNLVPEGFNDVFHEKLEKDWEYLKPRLGLERLSANAGKEIQIALRSDAAGQRLVTTLRKHQAAVFAELAGEGAETSFDNLKTALLPAIDESSPTAKIHTAIQNLFQKLDVALSPEEAATVKGYVLDYIYITGRVAEAELRAARVEWALAQTEAYSPGFEAGLTKAEQEKFKNFLRKDRFSNSDFAELENFYALVYDKLSVRGKDEMSKRVWAGTRK